MIRSSLSRSYLARFLVSKRCYKAPRSVRPQAEKIISRTPSGQPAITALSPNIEAPIQDLAGRAFGLSTEQGLQTWNGSTEHPDIAPDIPGYLTVDRISSQTVQTLWRTVSKCLPKDPLNQDDITSATGDLFHRSHNWEPVNNLQLGWHLAMSNAPIVPEDLCRDGTNVRFLPGPESTWSYRLWAGGSITLRRPQMWSLDNSYPMHVIEGATNLRVTGQERPEKAFVTVRKNFVPVLGHLATKEYTQAGLLETLLADSEVVDGVLVRGPAWTEEYTLCFLREKPDFPPSQIRRRPVRPPEKPKFLHSLTPNRHLLFCWSALTYNAHLIHLDTTFVKEEYGAPNLFVHGPLTLYLVCEWFRRALTTWALEAHMPKFILRSIEYRNIHPLYVDEPMTLCAKPSKFTKPGDLPESWDVWVQTSNQSEPSMAFKSTIRVEVETKPRGALRFTNPR